MWNETWRRGMTLTPEHIARWVKSVHKNPPPA